MKLARTFLVALVAAALSVFALAGPASAASSVTVGGQTRALNGTDIYRATNFLVMYTPAQGARTGTNSYGFEAAVVGGKVTAIQNGVGNMAIPAGGFVLSGHGTARTFLQANATVGADVVLDGGGNPPPPPPPPAGSVSVGQGTRALNGTNIARATNFLVRYTPAKGARTGTNAYGFEAAVVDGVVTQIANGVGNMVIPPNGYVLSGHGTARTFLQSNAYVGAPVTLDGSNPPPPPGGTELLPDVGIRTLRDFTIVTTGGVKLLKFPGVTSNIGKGPIEIEGVRSTSTSDDWVATQVIYNSDGSKTRRTSNVTFYFAGDGHTHWHMRDFDAYEIYTLNGTLLQEGEKHGFCFEDNTSYMNWPQNGTNGAPANPVYTHAASCGQGHPETTSILHGLSVGWGDTYPSTLPDQGINITGLANGDYRVVVTADEGNGVKESNENNNAASAVVRINGNTVTLVSTAGGIG